MNALLDVSILCSFVEILHFIVAGVIVTRSMVLAVWHTSIIAVAVYRGSSGV